MRTGTFLATVAVASLANAGSPASIRVSDRATILVSPPVRSANYYSAHRPERELVLALCQFSHVTNSSWRTCLNAAEAQFGVKLLEQPLGGGCPIPVC